MKTIILLLILSMSILTLGCVEKQAYQVAYQEAYEVPYQEAVYKTVDKIIYVNELQTKSRIDTVTKFRTLYSGTVDGYKINRAVSSDKVYTGKSFWGSNEYTVTICYLAKPCKLYLQVKDSYILLTPEEVPYTENIEVQYQVTVSVPKTVQETIIDRYDTKYKIEYRTAYRTEYR